MLSAIFNFYGKSIKLEICTRSKIPQVIKLPLLWLQIMIMKTRMTTCPNILPKSLLMGMMLHLSKVKPTPKVRCLMGPQTHQALQRQMNDTEMSISRHYFNLCQFTKFSTFTIKKCCEQINYSAPLLTRQSFLEIEQEELNNQIYLQSLLKINKWRKRQIIFVFNFLFPHCKSSCSFFFQE